MSSSDTSAFWSCLRTDAEQAAQQEPAIGLLVQAAVLQHHSFDDAIGHLVVNKVGRNAHECDALRIACAEALAQNAAIAVATMFDLQAVHSRDPACHSLTEAFLFYKGIHALAAYRLAHHSWHQNRRMFARWLQSLLSERLSVDIHPASKIGHGVFLDHAHGLVVGETAVIDNDVSILHNVTLGGTGKQSGDRHPKVRSGVLIGAGSQILGNIEIGRGAKVGAGSVVMAPVMPHVTVAGRMARVVGVPATSDPALDMSQQVGDASWAIIP